MKQLSMLGVIGGAALLIAAPLSLQWSQKNLSLSLDSAEARTGRPLTATRIAGVSRRVHRRTYRCAVLGMTVFCDVPRNPINAGLDRYRPQYISPPAGDSYYLQPSVSRHLTATVDVRSASVAKFKNPEAPAVKWEAEEEWR
jgi:hypothetical protein